MPDIDDRRDRILRKIMRRIRVDRQTGCWLWTGPTSGEGRGGGYARMCLDGQTVAVHRVVYTHYYGYVPGKKQIDHTCRNRRCCNPEHLKMVTHKENQRRRDEAKVGREANGTIALVLYARKSNGAAV